MKHLEIHRADLPARALLLLLAISLAAGAQTLPQQLAAIAAQAKGKVGVACQLPGKKLDCALNSSTRPPMQSVFKLPLAVTVLHQIEQGRFTLDQPIRFEKRDRILPETFSPLQDKYPAADVDVPLRELLHLAASLSDNAASEVLLRIAGGPPAVDAYIKSLGVRGFQLKDGEATLHRDHTAQYRNWFQPSAAVKFMRRLADHPPLNAAHMQVLRAWITESPTGVNRIKAGLPAGTPFAHKTGTSGTINGLAAATNDIGLIQLPGGRELAIAIFVTDSRATLAERESVMARLAQAIYRAATSP